MVPHTVFHPRRQLAKTSRPPHQAKTFWASHRVKTSTPSHHRTATLTVTPVPSVAGTPMSRRRIGSLFAPRMESGSDQRTVLRVRNASKTNPEPRIAKPDRWLCSKPAKTFRPPHPHQHSSGLAALPAPITARDRIFSLATHSQTEFNQHTAATTRFVRKVQRVSLIAFPGRLCPS
jgi:hypothetical protein